MAKRNNPETSKAADKAMTKEMRVIHFQKILAALNILGEAIYTEIAKTAGMEHNQVSRRAKEMVSEGLIYRTDKKKKTPSGRNAFVYKALVGIELPIIESSKTKTVSLSNSTSPYVQPSLFL